MIFKKTFSRIYDWLLNNEVFSDLNRARMQKEVFKE